MKDDIYTDMMRILMTKDVLYLRCSTRKYTNDASGQTQLTQDKDGCPIEEDGVGKWSERVRIRHLIRELGKITEGIGTIVSELVVGVVAAQRGIVLTGDAIVHVANSSLPNKIGVNVIRETNGRRGRTGLILDRPEGEGETTEPPNCGLEEIGVGHREESATDGVNENNHHGNPDCANVIIDLEEVADDNTHTDKISSKKEKEGCDGDARNENLDGLSVAFGINIGEGEDIVVVNMSGEEDTIQNER